MTGPSTSSWTIWTTRPNKTNEWTGRLRLQMRPWSRPFSGTLSPPIRSSPRQHLFIGHAKRLPALLANAGQARPCDAAWLHEIKYDGYRLQREGESVRLLSRNGKDWGGRYPWIVEAALKNRHSHFVIDGEAVVLGVDGIADLNALHSRRHNHAVQLYAFDILALDGEDLRGLRLDVRKTQLARLLPRRPDGIFVAPFEQGEIGPDLFRAACNMGLEGMVSKEVKAALFGFFVFAAAAAFALIVGWFL